MDAGYQRTAGNDCRRRRLAPFDRIGNVRQQFILRNVFILLFRFNHFSIHFMWVNRNLRVATHRNDNNFFEILVQFPLTGILFGVLVVRHGVSMLVEFYRCDFSQWNDMRDSLWDDICFG